MEEPMNVRYTFMLLLAICDPTGHIIGTDVAIARRLNMPVPEFKACIAELMKPDPHSNSKEKSGRRVIRSQGERGYQVVNYLTYRDMKTPEQRRDYMRNYMREKRAKSGEAAAAVKKTGEDPQSAETSPKNDHPTETEVDGLLTPVNTCKLPLAMLGHADADADATIPPIAPTGGGDSPIPTPTEEMIRLNALFRRRDTTRWSDGEKKALRKISPIPDEELSAVEKYYRANIPNPTDYRRHDLATLLNNWNGEVDRARNFKTPSCF